MKLGILTCLSILSKYISFCETIYPPRKKSYAIIVLLFAVELNRLVNVIETIQQLLFVDTFFTYD